MVHKYTKILLAVIAIFIFIYTNDLLIITLSLPLSVIAGYLISKEENLIESIAISGSLIMSIGMFFYAVFVHIRLTPLFNIQYVINGIIFGLYLVISALTAIIVGRSYKSDTVTGVYKTKSKLFYFSIILLLILSLVQSFLMFKGSYYDHTDSGLIGYPITNSFNDSMSIWNPSFYTGAVNSAVISTPDIALNVFESLFTGAFGVILGTELFFWLLIFIGSVGLFLLIRELTPISDTNWQSFVGIASAILFSFYFYPQYGATHTIYPAFLPITIFFLFRLYESIRTSTLSSLYATLSAISCALLIGVGSAAYLLPNMIIILMFLFIFTALGKNKKLMLKYAIFIIVILILVNSTMFISLFLYINNNYSSYFNSFSYNILTNTSKENILVPFEIYGVTAPSLMLQYSNNSTIAMIAEIIIFLIGFVAIYFFSTFDEDKRIFVIWLYSIAILTVFFYANFSAPFGYIFQFIIAHFSILLADRAPDPIFYYTAFFVQSILFAIGATSLYKSLGTSKKKVFVVLILAILIIRLYYFDAVPMASINGIHIPNYYYQISNYINNRSNGFNVATLPSEYPFGHFANFYYGTDIYSYLINDPVFTGGYVATSTSQLNPIPVQSEYYNISNSIQNGIVTNKSYIASQLGDYGIKYIIIQGDSAPNGTADGYLTYNYTDIYSNLGSSDNISLVAKYNGTSIYEDTAALPFVFTAYNKTVSYDVLSPTEIIVNLHNASLLYLRQTYNPNWIASYLNGTTVLTHNIGLGYMNEWKISPNAKRVIINYSSEKWVYLSWLLSIVTLIGTVILLAFMIIISSKNKPPIQEYRTDLQNKELNTKRIISNPLILSSIIVIIGLLIVTSGISILSGNIVNSTIFNGVAGRLTITNNVGSEIYAINYTLPTNATPSYDRQKGIIFFYKNATEVYACKINAKNMTYLLYNLHLYPNKTLNVSYSYVNSSAIVYCSTSVFTPTVLH